jgi:RNA polymerase sigma-70 factor (ECF subfamily)
MNRNGQQITQGLKDGDNRAYKHLYDRHYALLCNIAFAYLKDAQSAQMLVDDTIFHIYEKRKFPIQKAILDANDLLTQNPEY